MTPPQARRPLVFTLTPEVIVRAYASGVFPMAKAHAGFFGGPEAVKAQAGSVTIPVAQVSDGKAHFYSFKSGGKDINAKAVSFVEANVAASFGFLEKLAKAKDLQAMIALQTEFAQSQMKTFAEQGKELGAVATKAMAEFSKPRV